MAVGVRINSLLMNYLYYGNNLEVLGLHVDDESVDLVYLDPPFKSNQDYNVLFAEKDGTAAASQIKAFEDTWSWNQATAREYEEVVEQGGKVSEVMQAFRGFLGTNDMLAYLTMMAPRLVELKRVMKATASIYLHCDPTASHYLKLLMDAVFEPYNFRSEIIWRRTGAHGKSQRFAPIHDTILFYSKTDAYKWTSLKKPYMRKHVEAYFVHDALGWKTNYYGNVLTGSGRRGGESGLPWQGFDPTAKGRHWAIPGDLLEDIDEDISELGQHEKLDLLLKLGRIKIDRTQAWPIYEKYLKPEDGQAIPDIWAFQPYTEGTVFGMDQGIDADVRWLSPQDQERLGYPTQKPEGLLERIIRSSSEKGDVVLDPFCGCGTMTTVAQRLERQWIGIDITHLAMGLIKNRLLTRFGPDVVKTYQVIGEPATLRDAAELAGEDPYQFQWWALGLVGARPTEQKKGADKGIDGRLFFHDQENGKTKKIILSVKSGHVSAKDVRDLRGVIEREKAEIGVLLTLVEPTKPMLSEATEADFYKSSWGKHPRLQILTIEELLAGKRIDYPPTVNVTFKKAQRALGPVAEQLPLTASVDEGPTIPAALPAKEAKRAKGKKAKPAKGKK